MADEQRNVSQEKGSQVLERGDVYFVYRPRVEHEQVRSFDDIQRMYMILHPQGEERYEMIALGKKQLPEVKDGGGRFWGFVDKVGSNAEEVGAELEGGEYGTKTRGEREIPSARPAGEGVYAIVRHRDHTHIAYALELPDQPREVQDALNIEEEASYILSVKNPEQPSPKGVGLDGERKADFPKELQDKFKGRRFFDVDPPDFLGYEGAEVLFIGAGEDVSEELGITLNAEDESESSAEIFSDLRLEKSQHPVKPLLRGQWA